MVGVIDPSGEENVPKLIKFGLYALQHRGQANSGMVVSNLNESATQEHKGMGLVSTVMEKPEFYALRGNVGVGYVGYEPKNVKNIQPFSATNSKGSISIVMDGKIINTCELRAKLSEHLFQSDNDAELLMVAINKARGMTGSIEDAVMMVMRIVKGAYSAIIQTTNKMVAVRDPLGIKPLCMGHKGGAHVFASESCALTTMKGVLERDVDPGEVVVVTKDGVVCHRENCPEREADARHCAFEYVYRGNVNSKIDGVSVFQTRKNIGHKLGRLFLNKNLTADAVAGVPDSGLIYAEGFAEETGIPYTHAISRNPYMGRTFIRPDANEKEITTSIKTSVIPWAVDGKKLAVVEDSIVTGNVAKSLIHTFKECGAEKVHFVSASPPYINPCPFDHVRSDMTTKSLIAVGRSNEEIADIIGSDSVTLLPLDDFNNELTNMSSLRKHCTTCFDGRHLFGGCCKEINH